MSLTTFISKLIMPAQKLKPYNYNRLGDFRYKLKAQGGHSLDVAEYYPSSSKRKNSPKVVIYAGGNNEQHENTQHHARILASSDIFKKKNIKLITFNFRNVGLSTGKTAKSEQDWINDVLSIVEHYHLNEGIAYKDIILIGQSLGAAIITLAAAELHARNKANKEDCVKIINGRSFKNIAAVIARLKPLPYFFSIPVALLISISTSLSIGLILILTLNSLATIVIPIVCLTIFILPLAVAIINPTLIALPILNMILGLFFSKMDALAAYKSLPDNCKSFYYVKDDETIRNSSGLYDGLKPKIKFEQKQLKAAITTENNLHQRQVLEARLWEIKSTKLKYKYKSISDVNSHNAELRHCSIGSKKAPAHLQDKTGDDLLLEKIALLAS